MNISVLFIMAKFSSILQKYRYPSDRTIANNSDFAQKNGYFPDAGDRALMCCVIGSYCYFSIVIDGRMNQVVCCG